MSVTDVGSHVCGYCSASWWLAIFLMNFNDCRLWRVRIVTVASPANSSSVCHWLAMVQCYLYVHFTPNTLPAGNTYHAGGLFHWWINRWMTGRTVWFLLAHVPHLIELGSVAHYKLLYNAHFTLLCFSLCKSKKQDTRLLPVTLSYANRFS